ncbi:Transcription factor mbp1 [Coemansia sp. RSA 1200]|nr:Transcription factor mbp1 [Coemansia sp. RSA 1200]
MHPAHKAYSSSANQGAMDDNISNQVWSASYAGVEVFQLLCHGVAVMRRRKDSYINVTQVLKCAQYDKPRRTRFLEREIHTGIHEKVQGGYGKYQGTWVPMDRAVALAQQLNVYNALRVLFEYNPAPGEKPPTAPRSLESLNKRKLADVSLIESKVKTKPKAKPAAAARRRTTSSSALPTTQHQQHSQNHKHRHAGSLAIILNSYSSDSVPLTRQAPEAPSPSSSPSPPLASVYGTPGGNGNGNPQYRVHHPQMHTPGSHRVFTADTTPLATGHYAHGAYLTPETPESGRTLYYGSGSGRTAQRPAAVQSGSALRDISNTYQAARNDGRELATGPKDAKRAPPIAAAAAAAAASRPLHSLMTPPSSSSAANRRLTAAGGPGAQTPRLHHHLHNYNHRQSPSDDGLLVLLRPPVPSSAGSGCTAARRLSGVQSWGGSPVAGGRHSVGSGGSASSTDHSRTGSASSSSGMGEAGAAPISWAGFVEYISKPRTPGTRLPSEVERFVRTDSDSLQMTDTAGGNRNSNRSLHLATANAHWDVAWLLVARGADVASADRDGRTALMVAVSKESAWEQRDANVFAGLVDALAPSVACRDRRGRSAVHWACLPPTGENAAKMWPAAALYYITYLVRALRAAGRTDVLAWRDYSGYSAEQLARLYGLDDACAALAEASGADDARSDTSSPELSDRPQHSQNPQSPDQYLCAVERAEGLVRSSVSAIRARHQAESRAVEGDIEYAAQLLLELSGERDGEKARANDHGKAERETAEAEQAERCLKRKIEHVVGLQQSARASAALRCGTSVRGAPASVEELKAEYSRLRRSVDGYERETRRLASEYASLAAVVRPWARPPALSLVRLFGGDAAEAEAEAEAEAAEEETEVEAEMSPPIDAEAAEIKAIHAVLETEQQRVHKLERVVAAACGDHLTLDKVRTVVGPVLSVLNNGNTL